MTTAAEKVATTVTAAATEELTASAATGGNKGAAHPSAATTATKPGGDKSGADKFGGDKSGGAAAPAPPEKRRALGRGLESLLPGGPRIVSGGAMTGPAASPAPRPAVSPPAIPATQPTSAAERDRSTSSTPHESEFSAGNQTVATGASAATPSTPSDEQVRRAGAPAPHASIDLQGVATSAAHEPALEPEPIGDLSAAASRTKRTDRSEEVVQLAIDAIEANPYQTRSRFTEDFMHELADSIKVNGIIQPIVVRPSDKDGKYKLVLGERRLRAAKMAGLENVPAIVRRVNNEQAAEMTVVENIQRQDLFCLEQAAAFAMLSKQFGLTQEEIGQKVGVSRETVSNYMRLLKLPFQVHEFLVNGQLEFSHARELLNLLDPTMVVKVAEEAAKKHMSVVQLETLIFETNVPLQRQAEAIRRGARWVDPNVKEAQRQIQTALGLKVRIRDRKGKGKITIEYATLEDFDRVVEMLSGRGE